MKRVLLLLCLLGVPTFQAMRSADYGSCHNDLDDLRRKSDDAANKANEAKDAEEELEHCRNDDENKDGCASKISELESQQDSLESALDDVGSKVRSASSSCGYDFAAPMTLDKMRQRTDRSKQRYCASLNRMRNFMTPEMLLSQCKQGMSDEECRRCLGIR